MTVGLRVRVYAYTRFLSFAAQSIDANTGESNPPSFSRTTAQLAIISIGQPSKPQLVSQISTRSDDTNPYETIDDYITQYDSRPNTPPPLPRKRLSDIELRLEILYDSVNNLLVMIKDLEQRARLLESDSRSNATMPEWPQANKSTDGMGGLLIDISDDNEMEAFDDSLSIPDYPAPTAPKRKLSECYLQPNSSAANSREPVYAEIRKDHVKIYWS